MTALPSSDTVASSPSGSRCASERRRFPTVGILGGGQLAQMLCSAANKLGLRTRVYQTHDSGPGSSAHDVFTGPWDDAERLGRFLDGCDVLTLDNEWVELGQVLRHPLAPAAAWPSEQTMSLVSDKVRQKHHARASGLPTGPWMACSSPAELSRAAAAFGFPMMVKRPLQSYDGYGNRTVYGPDELEAAYAFLSSSGTVLVEQWVPFERELAVMVARRPGGEMAAYPVAATVQRDHRCEAVEVPAPISPAATDAARSLACQAAQAYGCVGVVGVELFAMPDGTLLLNEVAPRPHNSGHYTIDACVTSQFENHLRAILDLPLGDTALLRPAAVMVNVLGQRDGASCSGALGKALAVPGASVHIYGKREVRPGRKMGHVTVLADTVADARPPAYEAARLLEL